MTHPKQVAELPLNLRNVVGLSLLNSSVNSQTRQQWLAGRCAVGTAGQDMSFMGRRLVNEGPWGNSTFSQSTVV